MQFQMKYLEKRKKDTGTRQDISGRLFVQVMHGFMYVGG